MLGSWGCSQFPPFTLFGSLFYWLVFIQRRVGVFSPHRTPWRMFIWSFFFRKKEIKRKKAVVSHILWNVNSKYLVIVGFKSVLPLVSQHLTTLKLLFDILSNTNHSWVSYTKCEQSINTHTKKNGFLLLPIGIFSSVLSAVRKPLKHGMNRADEPQRIVCLESVLHTSELVIVVVSNHKNDLDSETMLWY